MSLLEYPVAVSAKAALVSPLGFAPRQREAYQIAIAKGWTGLVRFCDHPLDEVFSSRHEAEEALRAIAPGALSYPYVQVLDRVVLRMGHVLLPPQDPVFQDGQRWPSPRDPLPVLWHIQVRFWEMAARVTLDEGVGDLAGRADTLPIGCHHRDPQNALLNEEILPDFLRGT